MKRLLISSLIISALINSSCRKPTLTEIIDAVNWSVKDACNIEYLTPSECQDANEIIIAVKDIINNNNLDAKLQMQMLIASKLNLLPDNSKIKFYFKWVLLIP